jgi:hypothetical protein
MREKDEKEEEENKTNNTNQDNQYASSDNSFFCCS